MPGVIEGGELGVGGTAGFIFEEDVVGAVGVEGRVEVDQVDGGIWNVGAEDREIVAEIEGIHMS